MVSKDTTWELSVHGQLQHTAKSQIPFDRYKSSQKVRNNNRLGCDKKIATEPHA